MKVNDHNKYRLFDYNNDMTNVNFQLGEVLINSENEIGVVIQLHEDGDCRTDMFGNCSPSEVRLATISEIKEFRKDLLNDLAD